MRQGASGLAVATATAEAARAPQALPVPRVRIQAIDWLRGLVMVLMTIDHAGGRFDAHHLHGDTAATWVPGSPLPAGEFLTRWITHLCAPSFVLLAGASLALSLAKKGEQKGQTAFIVRRGLLIAGLELWMALGFWRAGQGPSLVLQVLYAIGLSMVAMAFLRRLPTWALLAGAIALQLGGEWVGGLFPQAHHAGVAGVDATVWRTPLAYLAGALLLDGGPLHPRLHMTCAYPVLPWLSMMMLGWVLGRWLLAAAARPRAWRAGRLALLGVGLLALFGVVRGVDGYGNWGLHRDSRALLQWLHVAKYPASLGYTLLELGIALLMLGGLVAIDDGRPRRMLAPLALLGATAFFYYLLHVHLMTLARVLLPLDPERYGLAKTYLGAAAALFVLYPLCGRYRRYKAAHPDGWTRYL